MTTDDMKTKTTTPFDLETLLTDDVDAEHLKTLDDEALRVECLSRLEQSYALRGDAFHPVHDAVDRARLECDRREQPHIFDAAFNDL